MALENKVFDDPTPKWYNLQERTKPFEDVLSYKGDIIVCLKFVPPDMTVHKKGKRSRGALHVLIKAKAKVLTAVKANGTSDPFCKIYLLPDKDRSSKQKTPVARKTVNPVWNYTFIYDDVTLQELAEKCLELTVWDHDRLANNEFLGGVRFSLGRDNCAAERSYREAYGSKYSGAVTVNSLRTSSTQLIINAPSAAGVSEPVKKMKMSQTGFLYTLRTLREPIVDYQEGRGVPRNEKVAFVALITSLCTQAYTAAITILVMLWNLAPLLDGFVYFARFLLDKLIDILETEDQKEKAMKTAVFAGEIIVVMFIIFLILGLIFMPVYVLTAKIISKIWGMIAW